jgi:hypothetical protein
VPDGGVLREAETTPSDILRAIAGTDRHIADAADALLDLVRSGGNVRAEDVAASRAAEAAAKEADAAPIGQGALLTPSRSRRRKALARHRPPLRHKWRRSGRASPAMDPTRWCGWPMAAPSSAVSPMA